jgi:hypothetical protein
MGKDKGMKYTETTGTEALTFSTKDPKYDRFTEDVIEWVRNVPLESDAVTNLPRIMRAYEDRKSFKERLLALFR